MIYKLPEIHNDFCSSTFLIIFSSLFLLSLLNSREIVIVKLFIYLLIYLFFFSNTSYCIYSIRRFSLSLFFGFCPFLIYLFVYIIIYLFIYFYFSFYYIPYNLISKSINCFYFVFFCQFKLRDSVLFTQTNWRKKKSYVAATNLEKLKYDQEIFSKSKGVRNNFFFLLFLFYFLLNYFVYFYFSISFCPFNFCSFFLTFL